MRKRLIWITLASLLLFSAMSISVWAGPPPPPGATPRHCSYQGQLYPHGFLQERPLILQPSGIVIRTDTFECVDGRWVYRWSSDDVNIIGGPIRPSSPDLSCEIEVVTGLPNNQFRFDFTVSNMALAASPAVQVRRTVTWHEAFEDVQFDSISATGGFGVIGSQTYPSPPFGPLITGYYMATMEVDITGLVNESNEGNNTCSLKYPDFGYRF
ncbi:MAG: CARDB domain-containing protein [Chloroflexota bacterium]